MLHDDSFVHVVFLEKHVFSCEGLRPKKPSFNPTRFFDSGCVVHGVGIRGY